MYSTVHTIHNYFTQSSEKYITLPSTPFTYCSVTEMIGRALYVFIVSLALLRRTGSLLTKWEIARISRASPSPFMFVQRKDNTDDGTLMDDTVSRRKALAGVFGSATLAVLGFPIYAHAEDPLFRPNPLTNKLLEQVSVLNPRFLGRLKLVRLSSIIVSDLLFYP